MPLSRRVLMLTALAAACPNLGTALGQSRDIMSAEEANAALNAGTLILLDIRSRSEWKQTGVARGAWPVSLHEDGFGARLGKALELAGNRRVGLICASGGRSGYVLRTLHQNGVTSVTDITEGMLGSDKGPGWIASGLPVVPLSNAVGAMPKALAN